MNPPIYESEHGLTTLRSMRSVWQVIFLCLKRGVEF
ncbi:MAG TPA: hypothetical protein DEB17_06365 [Chlorobaculum sp.]|uniref:Uncharacterized protein n=1 Tax=Chlorobaculum tepidum (strain ATCC 49652 / DSM 12025 / NBRC 103806 / TLS) TaxID=194439 RepID=Q8KCW5_CHLTE|nr:hypothetical protein CT1292 [Chlorobaculum tepidum TLS]HBU23603.1 hypothetical protein [Chlorobaculum sp.]